MTSRIESLISALERADALQFVCNGSMGLEKESLRVSQTGGISRSPHPKVLGSALTNPYITTDYSEALLEFITPPVATIPEALNFLCDTQTFVYRQLQNESLWATSMPCILTGDDDVPIAKYGDSNAGRMKHIYRVGLGYRYGRVMQVIAGVHFNYSFDERLWPIWQQVKGDKGDLRNFIDDSYMGLLRNLQRFGWLIPYLFGASPAVCKSFFAGKESALDEFDNSTFYEPYATSLRMGDIGYQNRKEEGVGVKANYDSLEKYIASLAHAIETPALIWEEIGVKVDDEYRQLNANILQIENEYYSSVRPKQLLDGFEKPILALQRRGIRYVELRSLDVNAYHPLGVDEVQLTFLKIFMLYCLLTDSPPISLCERGEIDRNLLKVAHQGRAPRLELERNGSKISLKEWALSLLEEMEPLCDVAEDSKMCRVALREQVEKVNDPEETPSAKMLAEMRENAEGFYQFANRMSAQHRKYFSQRDLTKERDQWYRGIVEESLQQQVKIDSSDEIDFDTFLADYLAQ